MVYGVNLSQCIYCGKYFTCTDCIEMECFDCRLELRAAKAVRDAQDETLDAAKLFQPLIDDMTDSA